MVVMPDRVLGVSIEFYDANHDANIVDACDGFLFVWFLHDNRSSIPQNLAYCTVNPLLVRLFML